MTVTPLNIRSTYSLLQSTIRPQQLVAAAKQRGYEAISITDRNVLYAAVEFYNEARQQGIRPIIGLELAISLNDISDNQVEVTVIAQNQTGYQNLMQLSTLRMTGGHDLTEAQLLQYLDGCAVIVHPTGVVLDAQGIPEVAHFLQQLKQRTSTGFLGINLNLDNTRRTVLQDLSDRYQLGLIADERVDYIDSDQYFATQVLRAIHDGRQIKSPQIAAKQQGDNYLRPANEITAAYQQAGLQTAVENNERLVQSANFSIKFQQPVLPHFPISDGLTTAEYLRKLCVAGLQKRPLAPHHTVDQYRQRLNHELRVIHQMGFDDYFLIVWDIMAFAHRTKITTGPGRGSAAGSLVAYALAITDVDPLQYGLLFERFLNPERAQMPDIDLDIPDNRRQEVLEYVHQRYGHERVAQIITFGTLASRQVVRDVGRVFALPKYQTEALVDPLRQLSRHRSISLPEAVKQSQPLRNLMNDDAVNKLLIEVAEQLEGLPRHYSTHAAGVVLSATPLKQIVPLQNGNDEAGMMMTQFPKEVVESVGLLKMDFLGLRNLSIMDKALHLIHQDQPGFEVTKVPLDDKATIDLFRQGLTDGIFQFESAGIRQTLVELSPDSFEDIVAVNALYRPGPMENIPHFIARKHGREPVQLPDQSLEPILGPTYGILVYQEQVMQVASRMAGFTLGQADLLRRAMSKKKRATMESMRTRFIKGAVNHGYTPQLAEQVFNYIDQFANYGFNRSHAVAYSKMAFEMAYLKCHFPTEFFTALMSIEPNTDKERLHIADAKRFGVKVVAPNINLSQADFTMVDSRIVMGLSLIKGMRRDFIQAILKERASGPFTSLPDFVQRMGERWQKQSLIEPLIYSGAFDGLGYNRAEMIDGLPGLFAGNEFSFQSQSLQPVMARRQEYSLTYRLLKEKEYLGVYLSGHPVSQYRAVRERLQTQRVIDIHPQQTVRALVMINQVRQINTKKTHQPMAFAEVSDESGSIDTTIFPRQYQRFVDELQPGAVVLITGKSEQRNYQTQVIADQIVPVAKLQKPHSNSATRRWVVRIVKGQSADELLQVLKKIIQDHHGNTPVVVFDEVQQRAKMLPADQWLADDEKVHVALNQIFGSSNVVLQQIKGK